jgi:hypothetical protein
MLREGLFQVDSRRHPPPSAALRHGAAAAGCPCPSAAATTLSGWGGGGGRVAGEPAARETTTLRPSRDLGNMLRGIQARRHPRRHASDSTPGESGTQAVSGFHRLACGSSLPARVQPEEPTFSHLQAFAPQVGYGHCAPFCAPSASACAVGRWQTRRRAVDGLSRASRRRPPSRNPLFRTTPHRL